MDQNDKGKYHLITLSQRQRQKDDRQENEREQEPLVFFKLASAGKINRIEPPPERPDTEVSEVVGSGLVDNDEPGRQRVAERRKKSELDVFPEQYVGQEPCGVEDEPETVLRRVELREYLPLEPFFLARQGIPDGPHEKNNIDPYHRLREIA